MHSNNVRPMFTGDWDSHGNAAVICNIVKTLRQCSVLTWVTIKTLIDIPVHCTKWIVNNGKPQIGGIIKTLIVIIPVIS